MKKIKEEYITDPSFGLVRWSRTNSGNARSLFGSSLKHRDFITLQIKEAEVHRTLNKDWYFGRKSVAEVHMSSHQFSEFITSSNRGDGVPCTITYKESGSVKPGPAVEDYKKQFKSEFKESLNSVENSGEGIKEQMKSMLEGKTISKKSFVKLQGMIEGLITKYTKNLPFVEDSFREAMEKTIAEGKAEIESYVETRIRDAGLSKLTQQEAPTMIESKDE